MKKSIYFACAAALLCAACNEDYKDWADPQASTEGSASSANGFTVAAASAISGATSGSVTLLNLSAPAGSSVSLTRLTVNDAELAFEIDGNNVNVDAEELATLVRDSYSSLAPVERSLTVAAKYAAVNEAGEGQPLALDPITVKYTPKDLPANAAETEFWYLGDHNGWNLSTENPDKFADNGDGTYSITISIGDYEWFAFAPKSAVEASDWGGLFRAPSINCPDNRGYLDGDQSTGYSWYCEVGGNYTFTLDMVNYTYSYVNFIETEYYYIGSLATDKSIPLSNGGVDPQKNPVFTATIPASGADWHWFKIAPGSGFNEDGSWNWDNECYCACATVNNDEALEGDFVIGGNKYSWHLMEDQYPAKFYRLEFNFMTQKYKITPVNYSDYIYYAGDWTGWGDGKKELALTDADNGIYTGYYFINAVDNSTTWGFKFIDADGNWYGGGNGVLNSGDNCDPGEEGFYKIAVNWGNMTYELTKINTVSIIGGPTGDSSWQTDLDMTWDGTCWSYEGALEAGEFKFRANHDWNGINWGGSQDNLEVDKANASIAAAGNYLVKLYCNCPGKAYYTIESK